MPSAEEWKAIYAKLKKGFFEKHLDAVKTRTANAQVFVNYLQNEFSCNSAEVPVEYNTMISDGPLKGTVDEEIIKYALNKQKLNVNEEVDGLTLYEHFIKACIYGEHEAELKVWTKHKPVSRQQLVHLLVESNDLKDLHKDELHVDNAEFFMRHFLIKKLWNILDKDTYFSFNWDENDYMRALYQEVGKTR